MTVPPHNIEAEQSVLGAMLIESQAIDKAKAILTSADFYRHGHALLFEAVLSLHSRTEPVDLITIQAALNARKHMDTVGGIGYLTSLFNTVPTAANVEHYAAIVREKAQARALLAELRRATNEASGEIPDVGIADTIDRLQSSLVEIRHDRGLSRLVQIREPLTVAWDEAERRSEDPHASRMTGVPTGLGSLDHKTGGLQDSDLILLGARPSMGKTALCLAIAEHVALRERKGVALFSLEMSARQLATRMLCSMASVDSRDFRTGRMKADGWDRASDAVNDLWEAGIFIRDALPITPDEMGTECRAMQTKHNLGLIVVDYLQLCRASRKTENRTQEIGDIAEGLKALGRKFNCPVLALSQLSRAVEQRDNKRPMLSDLRESGAIEAHADVVIFLYREAYYKQKALEESGQEVSEDDGKQQLVEANFAKHRNGPTGPVKLGFVPRYARFSNWQSTA